MHKSSRKKLSLALAVVMVMMLILPSFAFAADLDITAVRAKNIISWMGQNDLAGAKAKLPATIKCTLSDASIKYLPVTWSADSTPAFNGNAYGNYKFTGEITCPAGITNTSDLKAFATVKVRYLTIDLIPDIAKPVAFGTTLADIKTQLGSTVKVNLSDHTQADYNVLWCADTIPTFSGVFPGNYTLRGQVICPPATTRNPLHLRPTVNITVLPPTALAITGVTAINTNTINVTFNQAVPNFGAIAAAGDRILLNKAGGTTALPTLQSNAIVFAADQKSATVTLVPGLQVPPDAGILFGESYTCILIDNSNLVIAVPVCTYNCGVLMQALGAPTAAISADLTKLQITYGKSMTNAALDLVTPNYQIFDSSDLAVNPLAGTSRFLYSTAIPNTVAEFDLANPAAGIFNAGARYKVQIMPAVVAADGTTIPDPQRIIYFDTPSIATAAPAIVSANIIDSRNMVINFNRPLNWLGLLTPSSFTIKDYSGHPLPVFGSIALGAPGFTTAIQVTLTGTVPADEFQAGQSYSLSLPANLVWNSYYVNAFNQAVVNYPITSQPRVAAALTSVSLVKQTANPALADLLMVFDRPVQPRPNGTLGAIGLGDIVFNVMFGNGNPAMSYNIANATPLELYPGDATGKTLVVRDIGTAFAPYASSSIDSIQVVIQPNVIATSAPGTTVWNTTPLVGNMSGIATGTPNILRVTLNSADQITVRFDRAVDTSYLSAAGIQVLGFARAVGGTFAPATLTGASQLSFTKTSSDTITINTVNPSQYKFRTGGIGGILDPIVRIAENTIKDATEPSLINVALQGVWGNNVFDSAAPVMIQAVAVNATDLDVTYTEDGNFFGLGSEATQFSVVGVASPGAATVAGWGVGINPTNVLTLTFGGGNFLHGADYSAATLSYVRNNPFRVIDIIAPIPPAPVGQTVNAQAGATLTGIVNLVP